jgi:hypothetical protein
LFIEILLRGVFKRHRIKQADNLQAEPFPIRGGILPRDR